MTPGPLLPDRYTPPQEDARHRPHIARTIESVEKWIRAVNGQHEEVTYNVKLGVERNGRLRSVFLTVAVKEKTPGGLILPVRGSGDGIPGA